MKTIDVVAMAVRRAAEARLRHEVEGRLLQPVLVVHPALEVRAHQLTQSGELAFLAVRVDPLLTNPDEWRICFGQERAAE